MAKSPLASRNNETFTYPYPLNRRTDKEGKETLDDTDERIDPEVLDVAEGEQVPWITLRIPRSKADVDAVADYTQSLFTFGDNGDGAKVEQRIARGNRGVFELLVEEWSFEKDFGVRPNGDSFAKLDVWAGDWISSCLARVVEQGTQRDYAKKTKPSSNSPRKRQSESASAQPEVSES